jgi:hypothetical protein
MKRMRRTLVLLLCALVAALGYVNWRVLQLEPVASPAEGRIELASVSAMPDLQLGPSEQPALSDFDGIVRRPLFNASRRPFVQSEPPAAREPARAPPPPPDLRLVGVAIEADRKQALLRTGQQPVARWVKEGESIDGWLLRSVRADVAVIASGERTHELRLYPALGQAKQ